MPTYEIRHLTSYRYRNPVAFGEHRLMLRPRESFDQRTIDFALTVSPEPLSVAWADDASGNRVGQARFGRRAREIGFDAVMRVEQTVPRPGTPPLSEHARAAPFSYGAEEAADLARFVERQHHDPDHAVDRWAGALLAEDARRETWPFLLRLNERIRRDFAYLRREEPGIQAPAFTLRTGSGSCRDFAVLMCEAVRSQGVAARFVSGYLHVRPAGDVRAAQAGGSTHAWLQVYLPGGGWIDFDPTSGSVGNAGLVRVAVVRDPAQASPIRGTFLGFPSDDVGMTVAVEVTLVDAEPIWAGVAA